MSKTWQEANQAAISANTGGQHIPLNPRKEQPVFSGVLAYFPDALLAVAEVSRVGNEQHNPGQPMRWDRSKSTDEKDALARHLIDGARGVRFDEDGVRHSAKVAWRALANLQKEIEAERSAHLFGGSK